MEKIQEYVDIKDYCTLKVGGQFRYFAIITNVSDLSSLCAIAQSEDKYKNTPIFILGSGSNIVFSDGVLDVFALKIEIKGFEVINETSEYADVKVGGGEIWDKVVEKTVLLGLSGLESLSAIPGTVGATPVQNVGAYGAEVKDTILEVEVFDIKTNKIKILSNADCKFGYRDSIFKNEAKGKYVIISVVYRLLKSGDIVSENRLSLSANSNLLRRAHTYDFDKQYLQISPALNYPGVIKYFKEREIRNPTLVEIRDAIIYIRREKLPNPIEIPNVGSFFKNPIVENKIANRIKKEYLSVAFFEVDGEHTKVPAGWLIENAGLKGKTFGKVSVYDKNALVLVNNGKATQADIIKTRDEIIKIVYEKFGITLEQEPELV